MTVKGQRESVEFGDVHIRQLTPADAAAYRAIRLAGLKQNPEAFGSTFETEFAKPLAWFFSRLSESTVFGAFYDREILGVAGFAARTTEKEAHMGLLWGMYVRPEARWTGVARRLVEAVIDFARPRVEVLQLSVVVGNERARRLYTNLGFVEYGIERNSLKHNGKYYDEILMAHDLVSNSYRDSPVPALDAELFDREGSPISTEFDDDRISAADLGRHLERHSNRGC
jgi:RimJ/RimL family protein N-acetyltransferase